MADPIIDSRIPLTAAMGVVKGMSPVEFIERWDAWSAKFPKEKNKLNPSVVSALDALKIIIQVEDTIVKVINTIEAVVTKLNDAYNMAMAVVPGVGPASAAKIAAEKAKELLKQALDKAIKTIQELPQTVYDYLAVNVKVDEGAIL